VVELTAAVASSARTLESAREQNASLQDQLDVVGVERRQLLAVATNHDLELTGKLALWGGLFGSGGQTVG
jgi:hypothetical protein